MVAESGWKEGGWEEVIGFWRYFRSIQHILESVLLRGEQPLMPLTPPPPGHSTLLWCRAICQLCIG